MTHLLRLFGRVLAVCALALAFVAPATAQTLLGVYYGNQGWNIDQLRAMESWQRKRNAVVNLFTDWCSRTKTLDNLFNQQLPALWANGNVPLVSWEPYICSSSATPADVEVRAARGDYDAYIGAWADRMKKWLSGPDGIYGNADDRRAYLRLAHEMNGNWYPWGAMMGNNTASDYTAMWRRVWSAFNARGIDRTRLQWVWAVNHTDSDPMGAEAYFPGVGYVDWIGIDGYNWGASQSWSSWQTPDQVFGPMLARMRAIAPSLPITFTEYASTTSQPGRVDIAAKSQWITQFFTYASQNGIRMALWFNEDKETDWAIFGGTNGDETFKSGRTTYKAYASYRQAVTNGAWLVPSDTTNPRLMTDAVFAGQ